jgi:sporulation protein YlmC with PRC-barrel domain
MRIGSGIAAAVTITLIAAAGVGLGDNSAGALADRSGRPAQPRALAQAAEPSAPAEQPGQQPSPAAPASPAPAPPAGAAPPNPGSGTPAVVLDDQEVSSILGKSVRSNAGEDMGRIVDVIVNHDGQVRAAIIDFGGFLGIGTRKIAVDWRALNFAPAGKPGAITLDLTRNQVRLAPEYKRGEPVVVVGAPGGERAVPSSEAAAPER